jgi:dihydrolipoamide dehydrogenase
METRCVDVAIVGAGTAGLNAHREVLKRGGRPLLIERGVYGTTCARVGCMPSKLLIAAADAAHGIVRAGRFGVQVEAGWQVDGRAVMDRVRRERDHFAGFMVKQTEKLSDAERLRGHARFLDATILLVDEHTRVEAKAVVIAAGSHPSMPPPLDRMRGSDDVITSDEIFELDDLPPSLAVIGTGANALELGQAMLRLGVPVAFFNPSDDLGLFSDPELKRAAHAVMATELDLRLFAAITEAKASEHGIKLSWEDAGGVQHQEAFAKVLVATGRQPNLEGLDLGQAGVSPDDKGMPASDPRTTQCGDLPIFLAGDINKYLPLLHEAADEGTIAGENAMAFPDVVAHVRRTPLSIAFTDPQMAVVGLRYADLREESIGVGQSSFEDQGRARVVERDQGLVRIYAEAKGCRLIGAELFGPSMEHMAHLIAWSVQQNMTVQQALMMPFYHPVLEEGLRAALWDLAKDLRILGSCRCEDLAKGPGI